MAWTTAFQTEEVSYTYPDGQETHDIVESDLDNDVTIVRYGTNDSANGSVLLLDNAGVWVAYQRMQ